MTRKESVESLAAGECGRVAAPLALAIAVVVCAGLSYYFLTSGPADVARETLPSAPQATVAGPDEPSEVREADSPAAETGGGPREAGEDRPAVTLSGPRIAGRVTDADGAPLADVHLRWMPLSKNDLRIHSHDERALGREADGSRLSAGRLRHAFSVSQATASGADGTYELRPAGGRESGVVIASRTGYEMKIQAVDLKIQAVDQAEESAPRAFSEADGNPGEVAPPQELEINFQLGFAGRISGQVTDRDTGEAPPGVAVVAGIIDPDAPAMLSFVGFDAPSALVDRDGTYVLAGLPAGEYRVLPRSGDSDYVSFTTSEAEKVVLEPGFEVTGVDFQVARGVRIFGRVTGPDGHGVDGAKCSIGPTDILAASTRSDLDMLRQLEKRASRSGPDGDYELRGIPPGESYRITAEAEGYAPARLDAVELDGEVLEVRLDLALTLGSSISGHVYLAAGSPAPRTPVQVIPDVAAVMAGETDGAESLKTTTDESGAFRLEHLAAGEYRLLPGRLRPEEIFSSQRKGTTVRVDGVHDVSGIELTLEAHPIGAISGTVVDDQGTPIEGAEIRVSQPEDLMGMSASKAKTDADGGFSLGGLEGTVFQVGAAKPGYATVRLQEVAAGTPGLELVLDRHGRVSGRVITLDGPLSAAGGTVKAQLRGGASFLESIQSALPGGRKEAATDLPPDGAFSVEAPPGTIEVAVTVPGFAPARSRPIAVSPGEEYSGVEILVTSGAVLEGTVILPGGEPLGGATVTVAPVRKGESSDLLGRLMPEMFGRNRFQAVSENSGRFEVSHLAPDRYTVTAAHASYAPSEPITVAVARDEVREVGDVLLSVGGIVDVRVLDLDRPKPGIMVQLLGAGPIKQGMTLADGSFRFSALRAGEYLLIVVDVSAMQSGKMAMKNRSVHVADEQTTDVEVVFGLGTKIFGKVRGLPAGPMRMVTLRRPGGPLPEEIDPLDLQAGIEVNRYQAGVGMVGADETYEIADLEPGEYVLEIPRMPANPADLEAYKTMDRTPHYRRKITVEKQEIELDIVVR